MAKKIISPLNNRNYLYDEYIVKQKHTLQIAKEVGVSGSTISIWLKHHKIIKRTTKEARNINSLVTRYSKDFFYQKYVIENLSTEKIAKEIDSDSSSINKVLKNLNIPIKTCSDYISDLRGRRFGHLLVLERDFEKEKIHKERGGYLGTCWKCECDCGNIITMRQSCFNRKDRSHFSRTCGKQHQTTGYKNIGGYYLLSLERNAKRRGIDFNITVNDIINQFENQNEHCALTGWSIRFEKNRKKRIEQTASVDRIDPDKSYEPENIQIVHKDVNFIKSDYSQEEFLHIVNSIYYHQLQKSTDQIEYII